ncbi:MAG: 4Fe-4S dicluster domain-containing protein [Proteobacteria bacterium]|nr:4Fe-4S dicluster domain-containing protein [Pseudomonadota bacterium]
MHTRDHTRDIYRVLAYHLSSLGMGYPPSEDLVDILKVNFNPKEAEVALALPTRVSPLQPSGIDEIMEAVHLPRPDLEDTLEGLAQKGLLFCGKTRDGKKGYALQQVGFGFPQTFFWKGEDTPHARSMATLVAKYFNRRVTQEAYGPSETKPFRYIPMGETIEFDIQAVYPYHMMGYVIQQTEVIAVAHCPCRMTAYLRGRGCEHPVEVCMKFDDLAAYVIDRKLAREITKEEALKIIKQCEAAGLVHFVDNAVGDIKHSCNCCACACWSVGNIQRRKIPRDVIMATYFIRETDEDECTGCGFCVEVCPVDALTMEDDFPAVEEEWCIGCGVCVAKCPTTAAQLDLRPDKVDHMPAPDFEKLHERILEEKGLR